MLNRLWVGKRLTNSGGIFVHDTEMEGIYQSHIYLFDVSRNTMQEFERENLKDCFQTVTDDNLRKSSIFRYAKWLAEDGEQFMNIHPVNKKQQIERIIEDHKEYLKRKGVPYAGVKVNDKDVKPRTTHCYSCKTPLNSTVNVACGNCGWMICPRCGACGCGYLREADY